MKEKNFRSFIEMLKTLETQDIDKKSVENAIVSLIDSNDREMTNEQKSVILKKFIRYESKKENKFVEEYKPMNLGNDMY